VAFWIALAVFLVGLLGGLAYAILRGIALWRHVKQTSRAFSAESARIADVSARIQEHLDRAEASSALLREAATRLSVSRARLDVQLQAIREARYTVRRLLWFLPGA
jgi:CHASE1-domain containing sensor protein